MGIEFAAKSNRIQGLKNWHQDFVLTMEAYSVSEKTPFMETLRIAPFSYMQVKIFQQKVMWKVCTNLAIMFTGDNTSANI